MSEHWNSEFIGITLFYVRQRNGHPIIAARLQVKGTINIGFGGIEFWVVRRHQVGPQISCRSKSPFFRDTRFRRCRSNHFFSGATHLWNGFCQTTL